MKYLEQKIPKLEKSKKDIKRIYLDFNHFLLSHFQGQKVKNKNDFFYEFLIKLTEYEL